MAINNSDATLGDWGELRFLAWVRVALEAQARAHRRAIPLGIGDDAAHLKLADGNAIVTTDALIEGVHFRWDWTSAKDLGAKSLAVNLSDLAAMGAKPVAAFLTLGVPSSTKIATLKSFFLGMKREGDRSGCPIVGGDLVQAPQWTINIMAIGTPAVKNRIVRRSNAKPGQKLYVTGTLGDSALGLAALERGITDAKIIAKHCRPVARLREAAALTRACPDLTMIDLSDGLMNDAGQVARESKVALHIETQNVPISKMLRDRCAAWNRNPLSLAICGGEDYELLFATKQDLAKLQRGFRGSGLRTRLTCIGEIGRGKGVHFYDADGKPLQLSNDTFQHFTA